MKRILARLLASSSCLLVIAVAAQGAEPDAGFSALFNGKDLSGWKTKKGGMDLAGLSESPDHRFKFVEGKLVIDPKAKGDVIIETAKSLSGDLHLKFEFLPGPGCNNDLFLRGLKFDLKPSDVKNLKENEWNQFEIVIAGGKAEFKNNGEVQRTSPVKGDSSPLGIRAEFGPVEFRNLQVKEGK